MSVTYRELESMSLGLSTHAWSELLAIAATFGWRPLKTYDGADLIGCAPADLITALERARDVLLEEAGDTQKQLLEVGLGSDYCACCNDTLATRQGMLEWYLQESGRDGCVEMINEFVDAVRELSYAAKPN